MYFAINHYSVLDVCIFFAALFAHAHKHVHFPRPQEIGHCVLSVTASGAWERELDYRSFGDKQTIHPGFQAGLPRSHSVNNCAGDQKAGDIQERTKKVTLAAREAGCIVRTYVRARALTLYYTSLAPGTEPYKPVLVSFPMRYGLSQTHVRT